MNLSVQLRPAVVADAEKLNSLRLAAIKATQSKNKHLIHLEQAFDWQKKDNTERITNTINDDSRVTEIAYDPETNEILGYLVSCHNEIERLFTLPGFQKMGVGKKLMQSAEKRISEMLKKQNKPEVIIVDSFVTSRHFYERIGFVATWSRKFVLDNSEIFTYWMVKSLSGTPVMPSSDAMSLSTVRDEIDKLDKELIELLMRRFAITEWVGEHKAKMNLPSYDESREIAQRESLSELAKMHALPDHLVQYIFSMIRDQSKLNHYYVRESTHFFKK